MKKPSKQELLELLLEARNNLRGGNAAVEMLQAWSDDGFPDLEEWDTEARELAKKIHEVIKPYLK